MSYQSVVKAAIHKQAPFKPNRFAKISERKDRCDIPAPAWRSLLENAYFQTWKGILFDKGPTEMALYPMLLYELKPKTIIEIGALSGGSAIWLADHLEMFQVEGRVYCIDIDLSLLDEKAKTDSRVHFLEGDCHNMAAIMPPEMLATLAHPWLIIEDAHANAVGVVEYFHQLGIQIGDYLIVEDTNQAMWELEWDDWDDQEVLEKGKRKLEELKSWLMNHQNEYLIDTYYQDMYGYNGSKNWNSILKKV
ncbi:CmcI family methyltransferase [Aerosakkonema funiforme]|uniref:CmcI family methyltransferase n=1 Tax=Aerosakkonema funiforme TaxID=1246630 RepID=UPI0035B8B2D3